MTVIITTMINSTVAVTHHPADGLMKSNEYQQAAPREIKLNIPAIPTPGTSSISTSMKIMPAKIKLNVIHHIINKFKRFANIQKSASLFLSFEKNTNFAHYFGNIM